jgi:hypothetical protein
VRALVVIKEALFGEELGSVEAAAAGDDGNAVLLVEHLVIDDPGNEVARYLAPIQGRMDTDERIFDRVGAKLQRLVPARRQLRALALPPGDGGPDRTAEVVGVQLIKEPLQVVMAALRLDPQRARARPSPEAGLRGACRLIRA